LDVVIGLSARNVSAESRRTALLAVVQQLKPQAQPGTGGIVLSAYPLDDRSLAGQPLRMSVPCIPAVPVPPDLQHTPTFQRAEVLQAYRKSQAASNAQVDQARKQLEALSQQLVGVQPPADAPTDIWGFLSVAADEFASVDSSTRAVIIVARDEEIQSTYCDGCHDLRGASVHFLEFDQPTPADEQRRRSDWSMWLSRVGASSVTFSRSNEPIPALFADAPRAAYAAGPTR
jgi:hypothetical protein